MRTALKRGVSLLEMLVAVGIFSVAFLAVIGVFPALGQAVARGRSLTLATQVAERVIEDQRGLGADSASSSAQVAVPDQGTFHYTCTVTPYPSPSQVRGVQVEVIWYEQAGDLHRIQLETEVLP